MRQRQATASRHRERPPVAPALAVLPLLAAFWLLAAATPVAATTPAAAQQTGAETTPTTLVVSVRDDAGAALADQEIFVVVSDGEQVTDELTGTSDAAGEARFADVAVGTGYTARAVTVLEGLPYQGDRVELTPGLEALIPLTIGGVSDTPANLHIDVLHIVLNRVEPGIYQALQVMSVLNLGQQAAYSEERFNGQPVGMIIPLPDAAAGVAPVRADMSGLDADRLALDGNRLLDLRPMPPGSRQVAVQYEIVTDAGGSEIEISLPYPTRQVSMLLGPGLANDGIESEQMNELEPVNIPDQGEYSSYTSDVLAAGDTLRFRLGAAAGLTVASWSLLALALALLASAGASIFFGQPPPPDPARRRQLVAEVARLDEEHAAGAIGAADYHARRAAALERLMEIDVPSDAGSAAGE